MEKQIEKFTYNDSPVTFEMNGEIMVNATEMARPFGKWPAQWQRLPSTHTFLIELIDVRKSHINNLIITKRSGTNGQRGGGGTWFHRDVAIEFARWLSPAFAIWCNDRIMELLTRGSLSLNEPIIRTIDPQLIELIGRVGDSLATSLNCLSNIMDRITPTPNPANEIRKISMDRNRIKYVDENLTGFRDFISELQSQGATITSPMFMNYLQSHQYLRKRNGTPTKMGDRMGLFGFIRTADHHKKIALTPRGYEFFRLKIMKTHLHYGT